MKVAIDIRRMTEFGIGTYTRNVVRALGRLDHENNYFLIGSPQKMAEIGSLPSELSPVPLLEPRHHGQRVFGISHHSQASELSIWCTSPICSGCRRALPCPYVMTVHDVLEHMYRAHDRSGLRRSLHFQLTRQVLQRSVTDFRRFQIHQK